MDNKIHGKFSLRKRLKSFSHAFNGLKIVFKEEHNARIHVIVALIVIICGFVFRISVTEWIFLCFAFGFVICTEILNSAIENLADFVSPEYHNLIKKIKDIAAGAVLISAIVSIVIGILIFLPKIVI